MFRRNDPPDPLEPLEIDGALLPRCVFIHGGPRVFTYYTPKEESVKFFTILSRSASGNRLWTCRWLLARFRDVWPRAGS